MSTSLPRDPTYLALCREHPLDHDLGWGDWACYPVIGPNRPNFAFMHVDLDWIDDEPDDVWVPRLDQLVDLLVDAGITNLLLQRDLGVAKHWDARSERSRPSQPTTILSGRGATVEEATYRLLLRVKGSE